MIASRTAQLGLFARRSAARVRVRRRRNDQVLSSTSFIHGGASFGTGRQRSLPENLSSFFIKRAQNTVARGNKDQACRSHNHPVMFGHERTRITRTLSGSGGILTQRYLPLDRPAVQVKGHHLRPWRTNHIGLIRIQTPIGVITVAWRFHSRRIRRSAERRVLVATARGNIASAGRSAGGHHGSALRS